MGYKAQDLVRRLPREIKLNSAALRVLDYLAFCANEDDAAAHGGRYVTYPRISMILRTTRLSRATVYRALNHLEYGCGFFLLTRADCKDRRQTLYRLHIQPEDLAPEAVLARRQAAAQRRSEEKIRDQSQVETYSMFEEKFQTKSQSEIGLKMRPVSNCDLNRSQNETYSAPLKGTNRESGTGNSVLSPKVLKPSQSTAREKRAGGPAQPCASPPKREPVPPDMLARIWAPIEKHLRDNVEPELFGRYWEPLRLVGLDYQHFIVECPYACDEGLREFLEGRVTQAAQATDMLRGRLVKVVSPAAARSP